MAKDNKAYINLATRGDYEYLTTIAFENEKSACLRLQEVRLRLPKEQKTFKLPLTLLTWFTKHAAAGREINREQNNHETKAGLYVDLAILATQIETFSLKDSCFLEIDFHELDSDDEALERPDQGHMNCYVHLYKGPKTLCRLEAAEQSIGGGPLSYPANLAEQGRFEIAQTVLRANEGPVDPRSDKRIIIAAIELAPPYEDLRHPIIERLALYQRANRIAQSYIRDSHQYEEQYATHPFDQKTPFPQGVKTFGPLLPQGPKEKAVPLSLALIAPSTDHFWQNLRHRQAKQQGETLKGTLELILPDPEANFTQKIAFELTMDSAPWLILQDGACQTAPLLIALEKDKSKGKEQPNQTKEQTLSLPQITAKPSESDLISLIHYPGLRAKPSTNTETVTLAIAPTGKDAPAFVIKPDAVDITDQKQHLLLLNSTPGQSNEKQKPVRFQLTCSWPDSQEETHAKLAIAWEKPDMAPIFAIDIGSKAIAMAKTEPQLTSNEVEIKAVPLGQYAPASYLTTTCLPATCSLSMLHHPEGGEQTIHDINWRARSHPLSFGYRYKPTLEDALHGEATQQQQESAKQQAITARLSAHHRRYDIALPPSEEGAASPSNSSAKKPAQTLALKRILSGKPLTTPLQKDEHFLECIPASTGEDPAKLHRTKQLNSIHLFEDCLTELLSFYATYLERLSAGGELTVEERNHAVTLKGPAKLILTYPDHASSTSKHVALKAGAKALSAYERGSFNHLGAAGDFLGLPSPETAEPHVHLLSETAAGAYEALHHYAKETQPGRAKKVTLLHFDIGHKMANISAFSGRIGETKALLDCQHSIINLPMGGTTLELMLAIEVAKILETAISAGAPIAFEAPLPLTAEACAAASNPETPKNQEQKIQAHFLKHLQTAIHQSGTFAGPKNNDIKLCLAKSTGNDWPLSLGATLSLDRGSVVLWQGLREEKLVLEVNEEQTEWQLTLLASSSVMREKVGALSTYLSFITDFLSGVIAHTVPNPHEPTEKLISITGGTSLYKPLQKAMAASAKKIGYRLISPAQDYKAIKRMVPKGAIRLIGEQGTPPVRLFNPNLIFIPQQSPDAPEETITLIKQTRDASIITEHKAKGAYPEGCSAIQLIETIPGLGQMMQQNLAALECKTYLYDLDRASETEWAFAESLWQNWLDKCTQTILNMPAPDMSQNEISQKDMSQDTADHLIWRYQSLQENEAELLIGTHRYWVSSGLRAQDV